MTSPRWQDQAACIGKPWEVFFPWPAGQAHDGQDEALGDSAKAICAGCPVRQPCLDEAHRLEGRNPQGVRGGLTPMERRSLLASTTDLLPCPECGDSFRGPAGLGSHRAFRHGHRAECGTVGGYSRHRRAHEPVCPACRTAATDYQRGLRHKKTA